MHKNYLISRRGFLKLASASSALYALSSCGPVQGLDPSSPPSAHETASPYCPVQTPQIGEAESSPVGSIYYVDATLGDDGNEGRSEDSAWRTLAQVREAALGPGDKVLFKRGEQWSGGLDILWSGGANSPIVIGAYGEKGPLPVIHGEDTSNCVVAKSQSNLRLENLELAGGIDYCALFLACSNVEVISCDMHGAGNDCLNFTGCTNCRVLDGKYHGAYSRTAGPTVSGIEIADGGTNFEVDGAEVYGNAGAGITLHNHKGTQAPDNVAIRDVHSYHNAGFGLLVFRQDSSRKVTISVSESRFTDNINDGLRITKSNDSPEYPQGVTLQNCEFTNNGRYAAWIEGEDLSFHHCLFASPRMVVAKLCKRLNVYNGTFFLSEWSGFECLTLGEGSDNIDLKNCIIASDDLGTRLVTVESGCGESINIDYVQYWQPAKDPQSWNWKGRACTFSDWKRSSLQDTNSPQPSDPRFVDMDNGNFYLSSDSPCIDAGVDVGLTFRGEKPDLGCFEH